MTGFTVVLCMPSLHLRKLIFYSHFNTKGLSHSLYMCASNFNFTSRHPSSLDIKYQLLNNQTCKLINNDQTNRERELEINKNPETNSLKSLGMS